MFECFEFMTRITLIAHWCFSWRWAVFTQCQGHFSFCPASEELAVHNKLGEDTTRAADPSRQRNAPHHVASCLSIQLGGLAEKVAAARGLGRHRSAGAKKLYYALFVLYILFYFLLFSSFSILTLTISTHKFYLFLILLPVPVWRSEWITMLLRYLPCLTRAFFSPPRSDTTSTDIICRSLAADSLLCACISQLRYDLYFPLKFCPTIYKNVFKLKKIKEIKKEITE